MRQHDFGLENHPLRPSFSGEMHVRKLPPLKAPARLMQVVLVSAGEDVPVERARLADLCGLEAGALDGLTHFVGGCGALTVVWERHSEFSSWMFIRPGAFEEPFALEAFAVGCGTVASLSLRQSLVPDELRGRVSNAFRMCIWGVIPIGALVGGLLAQFGGVRLPFVLAGIAQLTVVGLLGSRLLSRLQATERKASPVIVLDTVAA